MCALFWFRCIPFLSPGSKHGHSSLKRLIRRNFIAKSIAQRVQFLLAPIPHPSEKWLHEDIGHPKMSCQCVIQRLTVGEVKKMLLNVDIAHSTVPKQGGKRMGDAK